MLMGGTLLLHGSYEAGQVEAELIPRVRASCGEQVLFSSLPCLLSVSRHPQVNGEVICSAIEVPRGCCGLFQYPF